jgi:DHA1 family multidrug resistance protein-like MFS transporter
MSALRRRGGTPAPVLWLLLSQLVLSIGVTAMFPFVPLYVRHHGGGAVDIAVFVAGPILANALVQIPAGRLVDRIGRRPVLISCLACYGALGLLLALDRGPLWLLGVCRAGQGIFGGGFAPASRAALADLSPPERRAELFSMQQGAFMLGMLIGPAIGGALALVNIPVTFLCAGLAALAGALVVARRVPETRGLALADATGVPGAAAASGVVGDARATAPSAAGLPIARGPSAWWRVRGVLVPMVGLGAMGLVMSMYDVVWPLYLNSRGQGSLVIGLSITLYAVPLLVFSRSGGRLADRSNRRRLLALNFAVVTLTATSYPFLHSLGLILTVGFVEALGWVTTEPILYAVITDATAPAVRGRAMAAGGLAEYTGGGLGALVLGSLWGVSQGVPFWAGAAVLGVAGALCAALVPERPALSRAARDAAVAAAVPHGAEAHLLEGEVAGAVR